MAISYQVYFTIGKSSCIYKFFAEFCTFFTLLWNSKEGNPIYYAQMPFIKNPCFQKKCCKTVPFIDFAALLYAILICTFDPEKFLFTFQKNLYEEFLQCFLICPLINHLLCRSLVINLFLRDDPKGHLFS